MPPTAHMLIEGWTVVLPVKRRTAAKTRLARTLGLDQGAAGELAIAFAMDTLMAVTATTDVNQCVVVTDDDEITTRAATVTNVVVVSEILPPEQAPGFSRLNAALRLGAAHSDPQRPVAAMTADLPALQPAELSTALAAAAHHRRSYVADRERTGTTLLAARLPELLDPRFGVDSALAHRDSGAQPIDGELPGLRLDVDTAEDLALVRDLALGRYTAELLAARPCAG